MEQQKQNIEVPKEFIDHMIKTNLKWKKHFSPFDYHKDAIESIAIQLQTVKSAKRRAELTRRLAEHMADIDKVIKENKEKEDERNTAAVGTTTGSDSTNSVGTVAPSDTEQDGSDAHSDVNSDSSAGLSEV